MGLKITKETEYGITSNYWKIGNIETKDLGEGRVNVKVYLLPYVEKGAKQFLSKSVKHFGIEGVKDFDGNIYQYLYEEICKTEDFKDAINDDLAE